MDITNYDLIGGFLHGELEEVLLFRWITLTRVLHILYRNFLCVHLHLVFPRPYSGDCVYAVLEEEDLPRAEQTRVGHDVLLYAVDLKLLLLAQPGDASR